MSKRSTSLLLALTMLLGMFLGYPALITAEGSEDNNEPPTENVPYDMVKNYDDVKTYSFLFCWNGGAGQFPIGWEDGPVAKAIEEKTGVRLETEVIVESERDKLATIFMSEIVPDIVNAPHWSTNPGGEGELIKQAALAGLILNLEGLYEEFPNITRNMSTGVSDIYLERDLKNPEYEGGRYVIPQQTPRTDDDVTNWAYNIFVREDILKDLGYEQSDINTEDKLYQFLTEVKEGGYTDINGLPVIPAGSWHNGWSYSSLLGGFGDRSITGWNVDENGKIQNEILMDYQEERIAYMRKLIKEGLFDEESLVHSDSVAKEKAVSGRVAVITGHYPHCKEVFDGTLYTTNPEMRYVPVGPMENAEGEIGYGYERHGRSGSPAIFLSADIDEPERVLNFIDFLNSDEGLVLGHYGIEGTHYEWVDGIPTLTDEWKEIQATDSNTWYMEGFGIGPNMTGCDPRKGWGWDAVYEEEGYVEAREFAPMKFYSGLTLDDVADQWEGIDAFNESMATIDWDDEQKRAFVAETDEEAQEILDNYRSRMKDAGIDDLIAYLQEQYDKDPEIHW